MGQELQGKLVVHVNHELPDVVRFNEYLERYADVEFIPVPYHDRSSSRGATWRADFVRIVGERASSAAHGRPIVVIEDGGYFLEALHTLQLDMNAELCVEQTMFGRRRAVALSTAGDLRIPVISCARAIEKCRAEPHFLAIRLAELLSEYLLYTDAPSLLGKRIMILGYGILGRALSWRLRAAYRADVTVVEPLEECRNAARSEGFISYPRIQDVLECVDIIVGASGTSSLARDDLHLILDKRGHVNGVRLTLVSVSSGEVEFQDILKQEMKAQKYPWGLLAFDEYGRDFNMLADGRPLNFFGRGLSLPFPVAHLINFRLMEGLAWALTSSPALRAEVYDWASFDKAGSDLGVSEEVILRNLVSELGLSHGPEDPREVLITHGLYSVHPCERLLKGDTGQ
ncbi:hypothetical protein GCM10009811_08050 [Nostocoides veronense]|uniref:S-adenosyl-L-homocysteine hydrolase NAD binding domain-containing protein n=1 Tax=Nostocoides veronense TaxID=330836 RepID=A0ABP4XN33_9MICO